MNNKLLDAAELAKVRQTAKDLIDSILTGLTNPEIIIKFKLLIETHCKKQEKVPMEIEKAVHECIKNNFLHSIYHVSITAADFAPFFSVIKEKDSKFALKCLDTLNDIMGEKVYAILEKSEKPMSSWNILQLLLSVGKKVEISRKQFPRASFLSNIILGKSYKDLVNFFDRDFCDELDQFINFYAF